MINVVCAVILDDRGNVLACQRSSEQSHAGKWEFPGGKVEPGENAEQALGREIYEELGCCVRVGDGLPQVEYHYPEISIRLMPYRCSFDDGAVPQALEHAALDWVSLNECSSLDWAEADVPIWQHLLRSV